MLTVFEGSEKYVCCQCEAGWGSGERGMKRFGAESEPCYQCGIWCRLTLSMPSNTRALSPKWVVIIISSVCACVWFVCSPGEGKEWHDETFTIISWVCVCVRVGLSSGHYSLKSQMKHRRRPRIKEEDNGSFFSINMYTISAGRIFDQNQVCVCALGESRSGGKDLYGRI